MDWCRKHNRRKVCPACMAAKGGRALSAAKLAQLAKARDAKKKGPTP